MREPGTELLEPPLPVRERFTWVDAALLAGIALLASVAGTPWYLRSRKSSNECAATGGLKTICTSEAVFRECDKEQDGNLDYGMLSELSNTKLVDSVLGSGTRQGYCFEATYSYVTSEFLWFAVANPRLPTETGDRYWEINAAGVLFYTTGARLTLDTSSCTVDYSSGVHPCCK